MKEADHIQCLQGMQGYLKKKKNTKKKEKRGGGLLVYAKKKNTKNIAIPIIQKKLEMPILYGIKRKKKSKQNAKGGGRRCWATAVNEMQMAAGLPISM